MRADYIAVFQLIFVGLIDDLELGFLHLSEDKGVALIMLLLSQDYLSISLT